MSRYPITAQLRVNDRTCHRITAVAAPISLASYAKETLMKFAPLTLAALLLAAPAFALVPITQEEHINKTLLQGFIGDAIADNCPTIEARTLRALGELNKLRTYALKQGYSEAEVRAFVTDKAQKARQKAEAASWLAANGAVPGKPDEYCRIGEEQIAKNTLVGYLLRSTK